MLGLDIVQIITTAVPDSETWWQGEDYGPYNVNLEKQYHKILYCVTPTEQVVEYFRDNKYDLLISHHPFQVDKDIPNIILHTALDCCEGGLNDMWRDIVGIKDAKHFDKNLGWYGPVEPICFHDLIDKIVAKIGMIEGQRYCREPDRLIESVVVCSGLGGMVMQQALKTGADCYIFGENTMPAEETGFRAVIEIGHTRSENIGVNLFKKILPECQIDVAPMWADYYGTDIYTNYFDK